MSKTGCTQVLALLGYSSMSGAHLEASGDDRCLFSLAASQVQMQLIDKPGPKLHCIALLLNGEALVAGRHDCLHELVRAHLYKQHASGLSVMVALPRQALV